MYLWNRLSIFLILTCLLLVCTNCEKRIVRYSLIEDPLDRYEPLSDTITGKVYIDATVSMEGFVKPGEQTNYCVLMQNLRSGLTTGWTNVNFEFYKFGTIIREVNEELYQDVMRPHFYQDPDVMLITDIPAAMRHATENNAYTKDQLTIIVTDLFQTDNDIDKILKELSQSFLGKGLGVGLLGVRSQFDGTIYDIGIGGGNFQYNGDRPFYLIAIGHHSYIENFFNSLKASPLLPFVSGDNFIIFSHHLTKPLASLKNAKYDVPNKIIMRSSPDNIQRFQVRSQRSGSGCSRPKRGNVDKPNFGATIDYRPLDYIVPFRPDSLVHEAISRKCKGSILLRPEKDENGLIVKNISISGNEIEFKAEIDLRYLRRGTYYYEVILKPPDLSYRMPEWVTEWDMGNANQDGTRTINLIKFADNLWRTVTCNT